MIDIPACKNKVISPTGKVHLVEFDTPTSSRVYVFCGWNYGGLDLTVSWPPTDKPVTCKNCLKAYKRSL